MKQEDAFSALQARIQAFSEERDWDQFHTPKNLILAATSEMGELAEVLQAALAVLLSRGLCRPKSSGSIVRSPRAQQ